MKNKLLPLLAAAALLMLPACGNRPLHRAAEDTCYPKAAGSFRIVTYNVGAFGKYMENSTSMVAAMLKEVGADVVSLNELDSCNLRHNVNQAARLADALGDWNWHFGRAMPYRDGAYGNGVLTPRGVRVLDRYTVPLPQGNGSEPRSIAVVETDQYVLGAAHLDFLKEEATLAQVEAVNAWARDRYRGYKKPVFFCGDMNATPDSAPVVLLKSRWTLLSSAEASIPSNRPRNCIDFIFVFNDAARVTPVGSRTMTEFRHGDASRASDHLPVYADIRF